MLSKRWSFLVLMTIVFGTAFVVAVNCIVDTYGILRKDFSKQVQEPNKHFIKIKFLLDNKERFDSFLFGSSRVSSIDVKKIRSGRFYNMTYSEGLPQEHLDDIKFLLQNKVRIAHIVIGLDDFSYRVNPLKHHSDLMRQPHPEISGKGWLAFYGGYFMKIKNFFPNVSDYVRYNVLGKRDHSGKIIIHDIYDSGRVLCMNCDEEIERDPERHRGDPKFTKPFHYDGDNLMDTLASIRELVELTKNNHVRLTLFINPIHRATYLDTDMRLLFRFKKELAALTDFYDFSGLNSIATDNYYYHETSHYREMVGDMMLKRMFGYPPVAVPADFGVLVTRQNINAHLAVLRRQLSALADADNRAERLEYATMKNPVPTE